MSEVLRFYTGNLWACWVFRDHCHTILNDGSECQGWPPDSPAFLQSARDLGYGDDVYWHMMEHDLIHCWLTEKIGLGHSEAIWRQCHDEKAYRRILGPTDRERVDADETRVGALQAALNGKQWGIDRLYDLTTPKRGAIIIEKARNFLRPNGMAMTSVWASSAQPIRRA